MKALSVVALLALSTLATNSQAQGVKASAESADDADARSIGTGAASRIVLEAGDADTKATLRVGGRLGTSDSLDGRYALTVTAPFDRAKADRVDIGSLSGLTAGTSATLEVGLRIWPVPTTAETDAMTKVCDEQLKQLFPGYSWDDIRKAVTVPCDAYAFETSQLDDLVKRLNAKRASCAQCGEVAGEDPPLCEVSRRARLQSCVARGDTPATGDAAACALLDKQERDECAVCKDPPDAACPFIAHYAKPAEVTTDKELLKAARYAARGPSDALFRPLTILTVAATANTQHFKYVLDDSLDKVKAADKRGVGITFAATHVLRTSAVSYGYSHEESYNGADETQLCRALGTTGATTCSSAVIGAPEKQKAELAFTQYRVAFKAGRFALAPRVEFDVKKSKWAARVPFYFLANKAQELTAGVAVGYSEGEDEEFGAAIFISKAFTFY